MFFLPSVTVSFSPTTYTVTEGEDNVVFLILERGGDLTRTIVVSVLTGAGTAMGMHLPPLLVPLYTSEICVSTNEGFNGHLTVVADNKHLVYTRLHLEYG